MNSDQSMRYFKSYIKGQFTNISHVYIYIYIYTQAPIEDKCGKETFYEHIVEVYITCY